MSTMKIEFDSNSLEDMKLVRAMLGKRIREREAEAEEWRKMNERYDKSFLNNNFLNVAIPDISNSPSIAYSKLDRHVKNRLGMGGDIAKKKKEHRPK